MHVDMGNSVAVLFLDYKLVSEVKTGIHTPEVLMYKELLLKSGMLDILEPKIKIILVDKELHAITEYKLSEVMNLIL